MSFQIRDVPNLPSPVIFKDRVGSKDPVRLVFLDIDGVINNVRTSPHGVKPLRPGLAPEHVLGVDRHQVTMLNQFAGFPREDLVLVVLSTSWRLSHGIEETEDTLIRAGFAGVVAGATPNFGNKRASEIQAFLDAWADDPELPVIQNFVILDDCEPWSMEHLQGQFVQTDPMGGLQWDDVGRVMQMLFP